MEYMRKRQEKPEIYEKSGKWCIRIFLIIGDDWLLISKYGGCVEPCTISITQKHFAKLEAFSRLPKNF